MFLRFVGLCIQRGGHGLQAWFTLRNHVQGFGKDLAYLQYMYFSRSRRFHLVAGVEITYDMYSPILLKIECLKLEKRIDDNISYLIDAPAEYSTIPQDFKRITHPPGAPVPINKTIVSVVTMSFP